MAVLGGGLCHPPWKVGSVEHLGLFHAPATGSTSTRGLRPEESEPAGGSAFRRTRRLRASRRPRRSPCPPSNAAPRGLPGSSADLETPRVHWGSAAGSG